MLIYDQVEQIEISTATIEDLANMLYELTMSCDDNGKIASCTHTILHYILKEVKKIKSVDFSIFPIKSTSEI